MRIIALLYLSILTKTKLGLVILLLLKQVCSPHYCASFSSLKLILIHPECVL